LASCGSSTSQDQALNAGGNIAGSPQTLYTVTALPVAYSGPGVAVGKFHVTPSPGGIETDGKGGACLVFQNPGASCNADSDCTVPTAVKTPTSWAYCHDKQCWIKPSDAEECWKSSVPANKLLTIGTPVETPKVDLAKLADELFSGPAKDQINARVIACLNGKFVPGTKPPCAHGPGDVVEDFGPVRTLTK
jgi:hypothetical protein